jgi:hypothetical protein
VVAVQQLYPAYHSCFIDELARDSFDFSDLDVGDFAPLGGGTGCSFAEAHNLAPEGLEAHHLLGDFGHSWNPFAASRRS